MFIQDYADFIHPSTKRVHFFDKSTSPKPPTSYTYTFCGERTTEVRLAKHISKLKDFIGKHICKECAKNREEVALRVLATTEL